MYREIPWVLSEAEEGVKPPEKDKMKKIKEEKRKELEKYIGKVFGRLTILGVTRKEYGQVRRKTYNMFRCRCSCGKEVTVVASNLLRGIVTSCGCYQKEQAVKNFKGNREKMLDNAGKEAIKKYKKEILKAKTFNIFGWEITIRKSS